MLLRCLPSSFGTIGSTVWEEMSSEEFQDGCHGGHLGYQNRTILAILNLYNAPMTSIKFRLNLTWFARRCRLKNFKMAPWRLSEWNDFSNSESLCPCDASHKVFGSLQLKVWEEMSFEEFQDGHYGSHLGYQNGFSN